MISRAKSLALPLLIACALIVGGSARPASGAEDLGTKIKRLFQQPTPTPRPKKRKSSTKRKSSPSPSPSPKKKHTGEASPSPSSKKKRASVEERPTPSPTPEESESPTPKPKKKSSPSPSPSKRKHKSSPSPEPSETPTPSPSPTPEESPGFEESPSPSPTKSQLPGATISPNDITGIDDYPPEVRRIIDAALALTTRNLNYKYGSADPESGGMDCSGFIYFVLTQNGVKEVPRDASGQYAWVRKAGKFQAVISRP